MTMLFLLLSMWSFKASAANEKLLALGEEWAPPARRVWVGAGGGVTAQPAGALVRITGRKEGVTEVRLDERSWTIRVVKSSAIRTSQSLRDATKALAGLRVDWQGAIPTVEGHLYSLDDFLNLNRELPADARWEFRAEIPERLQHPFEDALRKLLGPEAPVQPLLFDQTPTALFNGSTEAANRWTAKLARWGLLLRKDDAAVEMAPVVRVEIAVAEIRRDQARSLGLTWPTGAESTLLPDGSWSRGDLLFNAKAFETQGMGRILARPNILCRSGREAEFVAGGEFPIKIFNMRVQDVIWKRYGIVLKVKPKADLSGRISLAIETEVSSIDPSRTVDGIPGLLTNRVVSQFDLARPRTIALSGLLKSEESTARQGLPGLSGLPILGPLFGSRDWRENRTELVVFVRPSLAKEVSL